MLFKVKEAHYEFMPWGSAGLKDTLINNFYWITQQCIGEWGPIGTLVALAAALVFMTGLKTGTAYASSYFVIPMRAGIVRDIRNFVYDKIVSPPHRLLHLRAQGRRHGPHDRRCRRDRELHHGLARHALQNPVMIIVCLGMMIMISWQLTLFVLVLLPIAGLVMGRVGKRLKRKSLQGQQQWGIIMSYIEETLGGLRVIKAFNAESKVTGRFRNGNQRFYNITTSVQRRQSLAHPMSELLGTMTIAIVLCFGGALILSGKTSLTAPEFIYYMVIFYSIINPAKDLSKAVYAIQKGLAAMERVDAILAAVNPIADPKTPAPYP